MQKIRVKQGKKKEKKRRKGKGNKKRNERKKTEEIGGGQRHTRTWRETTGKTGKSAEKENLAEEEWG